MLLPKFLYTDSPNIAQDNAWQKLYSRGTAGWSPRSTTISQPPPIAARPIILKEKAPSPGGFFVHTAGFSLPADLEAGSTTRAAANRAASTVTVGDHLDPKCILVLEV